MVEMSSLKSEQKVLQHTTHVHPLTKVDDFGGFICNGCNNYGSGITYRCASCNYDLHERCATCPPTLKCFLHPHELKLVFKEPAKTDQDRRACNICLELAEGLYYQCEACGFDMHPLCSQLPEKVSHRPHPAHHLELSDHGASNICTVCHGEIGSWRYKCGPCKLDVHMECVNPFSSAEKGTQQKTLGPQPLHQQKSLGLQPQPYLQPSEYYQPQPQPQPYSHPSQYQQPPPQTYFHPSQYQQPPPQTYFHPSQYQQPPPQTYFHPSQYQQPCHNQGWGYTNQVQQLGQQPGPSTGSKMFGVLMALTFGVDVFSTGISDMVYEAITGSLLG